MHYPANSRIGVLSGDNFSSTFLRDVGNLRTVRAGNETIITDHRSATFEKDWQQILTDEKQRMKNKEKDNKRMIQRLSGDLKREQARVLTELTSQATTKRKVFTSQSSLTRDLYRTLS